MLQPVNASNDQLREDIADLSISSNGLENLPNRSQQPTQLISLISNPLIYGAFIPTVTILNAAVGMLLPVFMTPRIFGEYALVVTLFQYGLIFDVGIGQLIDRWIPAALGRGQYEEAERLGQELLWTRLYIGVVVFVVAGGILVTLDALKQLPFDLGPGLLSALSGILYMCALGPGFLYRARSARRNYAFAIGSLSLGLFIARPAGLWWGGLTGCFCALAAWYLTFLGLLHFHMRPRLRNRPSIRQAGAFILLGLPFFATSIVWSFYLTANRWFASGLLEPESFGHFAFGANVYSLLVGAIGGFSAFYYPSVVGRIASERRFALSTKLTFDCTKLILAVGLVVAIGIVLATWLLALIYPQYLPSVTAVRILLAAVPAMAFASWLLPISLSSGHRPWIDGLLIYPCATAILYFAIHVLHGSYGANGVAGASIIAALPLVAMQLIQLRHADIITLPALTVLLSVVASVSGALCALVWVIR